MEEIREKIIKKPEVSFWVAIFMPIIMFSVVWGTLSQQVKQNSINYEIYHTQLERFIEKCEAENKNLDTQLVEIRVTLAEILKDIQFIKQK